MPLRAAAFALWRRSNLFIQSKKKEFWEIADLHCTERSAAQVSG